MRLRCTPSLESLDERLTPSATAMEMVRQTSIVVELAVPEPDQGEQRVAVPSVTDLIIDPFNPHTTARDQPVTGRITGVAVDPSDVGPSEWVFGTELPQDANRHVRHRMFAIVDRTAVGGADSLWIDMTSPVMAAGGAGTAAGDAYYGTGVYKSIDSGRTWQL